MLKNHAKRIGVLGGAAAVTGHVGEMQDGVPVASGTESDISSGASTAASGNLFHSASVSTTVQLNQTEGPALARWPLPSRSAKRLGRTRQ
jgi:hypothetical protein